MVVQLLQDPSPLLKKTTCAKKSKPSSPAWHESMFYLHFLALPMFSFVLSDLEIQFARIHAGPKSSFSVHLPRSLTSLVSSAISTLAGTSLNSHNGSPISTPVGSARQTHPDSQSLTTPFFFPAFYFPLTLNTITQLLCVAGVNRLTTRVSALTVTLVLVVRKAISLVLSAFGFGGSQPEVDPGLMWFGASLVFIGTIGYTIGAGKLRNKRSKQS